MRRGQLTAPKAVQGFLPSNLPAPRPVLSILMIGNSHSAPLPRLLTELAAAADIVIQVDAQTSSGLTLAHHAAATSGTQQAIKAHHYDVITLQEQGQVPGLGADYCEKQMYPPGIELARAIRKTNAVPWVYATYARAGGDPGNYPNDTYEAMQERLDAGYAELARRIDAKVIPVGAAFRTAHATRPTLALWDNDGGHASPAGYYLAATVFFAVLLHLDPSHIDYDADLDDADAAYLRTIGSQFVSR